MAIDMSQGIPNEVQNKAAIVGLETIRGVPVAASTRWPGVFVLNKRRTLTRKERRTGGYDRLVDAQRGLPEYAGTYAEELTFETLHQHAILAVGAGAAGVSDGEDIPGYLHRVVTNFDRDDMRSVTAYHGIDGLVWRGEGVMHDEFTVSIDVTDQDNAWKWSSNLYATENEPAPGDVEGVATGGSTTTAAMTGAGWTPDAFIGRFVYFKTGTHAGAVREILDNDATTLTFAALGGAVVATDTFLISANMPAAADPELETIPALGSQFFLDPYNPSVSTLGTTDISDRMISASVTQQIGRAGKTFWSGRSQKSGRGSRIVSGIFVVEQDRWDEWRAWMEDDEFSLRILQLGSEIDPDEGTTKRAQIDVERLVIDQPEEQERDNNMTLSVPWVGLLPANEPILAIESVNTISTLF